MNEEKSKPQLPPALFAVALQAFEEATAKNTVKVVRDAMLHAVGCAVLAAQKKLAKPARRKP